MKHFIQFKDSDGTEYVKQVKDLSLMKTEDYKYEYSIECGTDFYDVTKKEYERVKKILLEMES